MRIDGAEWASPKLLNGRLAVQTLDRQYGATSESGRERFRQIESMVTNWATGSERVGPLQQIFYVALQMQEPARGVPEDGWRALVSRPGQSFEAYRMAVKERATPVRQTGLPLVQDLHLLDATLDVGLPDESDDTADATDGSEQAPRRPPGGIAAAAESERPVTG